MNSLLGIHYLNNSGDSKAVHDTATNLSKTSKGEQLMRKD